MTKPYGQSLPVWDDDDPAPQSKHGDCRTRHKDRQSERGKARIAAKREIELQLKEGEKEDMFVCYRCGNESLESDRAGDSDECLYCLL